MYDIAHLRIRLQSTDDGFQLAHEKSVVRVQKADDVSMACRQAGIECRSLSGVSPGEPQ
jgi:hypothetical protein